MEQEVLPRGRAARKRATRAALVAAAAELFLRQGFDATTIEQIAAAAGVSRRTFFRHFPAKEDVLFSEVDTDLATLRAALAERGPHDSARDTVRAALRAVCADAPERRDQLALRERLEAATPSVAARSLRVHDEWAGLIAGAVASWLGVDRDADLRPGLLAGASVAALRAATRTWLHSGERTLSELFDEAFELTTAGLAGLQPTRAAQPGAPAPRGVATPEAGRTG